MEDYILDMPILFLGDLGNLGNVTADPPASLGDTLLSSLPSIDFGNFLAGLIALFASTAHHVFDSATRFFSSFLLSLSVLSSYLEQYHEFCTRMNSMGIDRKELATALATAATHDFGLLSAHAKHVHDAIYHWVTEEHPRLALGLWLLVGLVIVVWAFLARELERDYIRVQVHGQVLEEVEEEEDGAYVRCWRVLGFLGRVVEDSRAGVKSLRVWLLGCAVCRLADVVVPEARRLGFYYDGEGALLAPGEQNGGKWNVVLALLYRNLWGPCRRLLQAASVLVPLARAFLLPLLWKPSSRCPVPPRFDPARGKRWLTAVYADDRGAARVLAEAVVVAETILALAAFGLGLVLVWAVCRALMLTVSMVYAAVRRRGWFRSWYVDEERMFTVFFRSTRHTRDI